VSIIRFKRGTTGPTGLTLGEPAWDYANNRFFIGVTSEAIWVGAQIDGSTGLGTSQLKIPTQNAVKQYVDARSGVVSVNGQTGAVIVSGGGSSGVSSFNGLTGAVQGVSAAVAGTGISVSGATGSVTITNTGVVSINGSTGAITNVARINEGNTFTVRQVMNAGATMTALFVSNGITFNGTRFELTSNSSPTIIGTNTSTNNLILRGNNSSAVIPADAIIILRGGDLDFPVPGVPYIDLSASGRVNINTGTFGVTGNQTLNGTLLVTGLGTFTSGISASSATITGNVSVSGTLTTTGLGTFNAGITAAGATFTNIISFPNSSAIRIGGSTGTNAQILTSTGTGITWSTPSSGSLTWSVTTADATMAVDNGYLANKSSGTLTLTLPTTAAVGKTIRVSGMQNTWRIAQNASQIIHFGKTDTTTGVGGYLESSNARDAVELVCCVVNNEWNVISSIGNITIV